MKQTGKILSSKITKELRTTFSLRVCESGFYGLKGNRTIPNIDCDTPDGDGGEYLKLLESAKQGERIEVTFIRTVTETKGEL